MKAGRKGFIGLVLALTPKAPVTKQKKDDREFLQPQATTEATTEGERECSHMGDGLTQA